MGSFAALLRFGSAETMGSAAHKFVSDSKGLAPSKEATDTLMVEATPRQFVGGKTPKRALQHQMQNARTAGAEITLVGSIRPATRLLASRTRRQGNPWEIAGPAETAVLNR